jgi:hypothetical protein
MKTACEQSVELGNMEHKKYAQSFFEQLRKGYIQLETYRKELKNAKKNKEGKMRYIDIKKEIKLAKETLSLLRDEFNQWINGLPTAA